MSNTRTSLALRCILTLGTTLGLTGAALANNCDATQSPDVCQPIVLKVEANPLAGGVDIRWELVDEPPANAILVYRQLADTAGPVPGSTPLLTCSECSGVISVIDKTAQPGVQYWYWICALWDNNGQVCAPHWAAGLGAAPPPSPTPTYPKNLKLTEAAAWTTPTHWTRRWAWSWDPGNQRDYAFVARQQFLSASWDVVGSNLSGTASGFSESLGVRDRRTGTYRVCAASFHPGGGPFDVKSCSNSVVFAAAPVPAPKVPTRAGAYAISKTNITIQFASGDDNVSAWFDVQRLNGPNDNWLTLKPRVIAGTAGLVVDDGSNAATGFNNPFIYRVCAGNESGTTCTERFKAKIGLVPIVQKFRLIGLAGKCMDAESDGMNVPNGTAVTLYACMNGFDGKPLSVQIWSRSQGAALPIAGVGGKCLDVTGANPTSGTAVELWDCNGGPNQNWTPARDGTLRGLAGKCLDVAGGDPNDGTRLILWDCTGAPNQLWRLELLPL